MDITIASTFLPHTDPDASLRFYRDVLGFDVLNDVGGGAMRWITVAPPAQTAGGGPTTIVLHPPAVGPDISDEERRVVTEMIAKGTFATLILATADVDATFAQVEAAGAEVVQEPVDQQWGSRDFAVRDPAGNLLRVQQRR